MADPNRKRSRKSKLVPRNLGYVPDTNPPSERPKVLTKLNTAMAAMDSPATPQPTVEFNVSVECEEIQEDHDPRTDGCMINRELRLADDVLRKECERTFLRTSSFADKILEMEIKNNWGRCFRPQKQDSLEAALQMALTSWRSWACQSRVRDIPLFYKCYTCGIGLWHFLAFKDHIRSKHKTINIMYESYFHESCLIAWQGNSAKPKPRSVRMIENECPQCLEDGTKHITQIREVQFYLCEGCGERFSLCSKKFIHEGRCTRFLQLMIRDGHIIQENRYMCPLCRGDCLTEDRYTKHMIGMHTPRSDQIISMPLFKTCDLCEITYSYYLMHSCAFKNVPQKCMYCYRKFHSRPMLQMHETNYKVPTRCRTCNHFIPRKCMEIEHVIQHSRTYSFAFQCIARPCNKYCHLYPSESAIIAHMASQHDKGSHDKRKGYIIMVIVPKTAELLPELTPEPTKKVFKVIPSTSPNLTETEKAAQAVAHRQAGLTEGAVAESLGMSRTFVRLALKRAIDNGEFYRLPDKEIPIADGDVEGFELTSEIKIEEHDIVGAMQNNMASLTKETENAVASLMYETDSAIAAIQGIEDNEDDFSMMEDEINSLLKPKRPKPNPTEPQNIRIKAEPVELKIETNELHLETDEQNVETGEPLETDEQNVETGESLETDEQHLETVEEHLKIIEQNDVSDGSNKSDEYDLRYDDDVIMIDSDDSEEIDETIIKTEKSDDKARRDSIDSLEEECGQIEGQILEMLSRKDVKAVEVVVNNELDENNVKMEKIDEECESIEQEILGILNKKDVQAVEVVYNESEKDSDKNYDENRESSIERECREMQEQIDSLLLKKNKSWSTKSQQIQVKEEKQEDEKECALIQKQIDSLTKRREKKLNDMNAGKKRKSSEFQRCMYGESDDSELEECAAIEKELKKQNKKNLAEKRINEKLINEKLRESELEAKVKVENVADALLEILETETNVSRPKVKFVVANNDVTDAQIEESEAADEMLATQTKDTDNSAEETYKKVIAIATSSVMKKEKGEEKMSSEILNDSDHDYVKSWKNTIQNNTETESIDNNQINDSNINETSNLNDDSDNDDIMIINNDNYNFVDLTELSNEPSDDSSDKSNLVIDESNDSKLNLKHDTSVTSDQESKCVDSKTSSKTTEIIQKLKRVYKCKKCDFRGIHKDYTAHKDLCHVRCKSERPKRCPEEKLIKPNNEDKKNNTEDILKRDYESPSSKCAKFMCSTCNITFKTMRKYLLHFCHLSYKEDEAKHTLEYGQCPKCHEVVENVTKLCLHVVNHIKSSFIIKHSINSIGSASTTGRVEPLYKCQFCDDVVTYLDFFSHWESHLVSNDFLPGSEALPSVSESKDDRVKKEKPSLKDKLKPENLKALLDQLQLPRDSQMFRPSQRNNVLKACSQCYRKFDRRNDCKRHCIEHLLRDALFSRQLYGAFKCQICGEMLKKPDAYKVHMRAHGGLPIYKCELCDKDFSDSSNFTKHKKVHNVDVLVCDICQRKFQAKKSLIIHLECHVGKEPWKCEECDMIFAWESTYKKHRKTRHRKPDMHRFACIYCKIRFSSLREKWDHMWEIHRERKQKADCPICGCSFRKLQDVKRHLKQVHDTSISPEKPKIQVMPIKYSPPKNHQSSVPQPIVTENITQSIVKQERVPNSNKAPIPEAIKLEVTEQNLNSNVAPIPMETNDELDKIKHSKTVFQSKWTKEYLQFGSKLTADRPTNIMPERVLKKQDDSKNEPSTSKVGAKSNKMASNKRKRPKRTKKVPVLTDMDLMIEVERARLKALNS